MFFKRLTLTLEGTFWITLLAIVGLSTQAPKATQGQLSAQVPAPAELLHQDANPLARRAVSPESKRSNTLYKLQQLWADQSERSAQ